MYNFGLIWGYVKVGFLCFFFNGLGFVKKEWFGMYEKFQDKS